MADVAWNPKDQRNVDRFDLPESEPEFCPNCEAIAPTVPDPDTGLPVCKLCRWREGAW